MDHTTHNDNIFCPQCGTEFIISPGTSSRVWASVNTDALIHNYRLIRAHIEKSTPGCRIMCIVKADAYGHGVDICVPALIREGADLFAVSSASEALQLRNITGYMSPKGTPIQILILGMSLPCDIATLAAAKITQAVYSMESARSFSESVRAARDAGVIAPDARLRAHVKIDTGMNRIGFDYADIETIKAACALDGLNMEGIFTHFACAPEAGECTRRDFTDDPLSAEMNALQKARFFGVIDALAAEGITFKIKHMCNSGGIFNHPDCHLSYVRAGIALYGYTASDLLRVEGIRPVMRLSSCIAAIHTVRAGEYVSYGATLKAESDMLVATVPAGYADGIPRHLSGGSGKALIYTKTGKKLTAPIAGRVCMDQLMLDVTGFADQLSIGDEIVFFGDEAYDKANGAMLDDICIKSDTITHEILCGIGKRVPRVRVTD